MVNKVENDSIKENKDEVEKNKKLDEDHKAKVDAAAEKKYEKSGDESAVDPNSSLPAGTAPRTSVANTSIASDGIAVGKFASGENSSELTGRVDVAKAVLVDTPARSTMVDPNMLVQGSDHLKAAIAVVNERSARIDAEIREFIAGNNLSEADGILELQKLFHITETGVLDEDTRSAFDQSLDKPSLKLDHNNATKDKVSKNAPAKKAK